MPGATDHAVEPVRRVVCRVQTGCVPSATSTAGGVPGATDHAVEPVRRIVCRLQRVAEGGVLGATDRAVEPVRRLVCLAVRVRPMRWQGDPCVRRRRASAVGLHVRLRLGERDAPEHTGKVGESYVRPRGRVVWSPRAVARRSVCAGGECGGPTCAFTAGRDTPERTGRAGESCVRPGKRVVRESPPDSSH